jgi:hypothetical protein
MAVIMMSEVTGQTAEGYDALLGTVGEAARRAPGFIAHAAYGDGGSWHLVEIWRSKAECDQFFAQHVAPYLPPGIRPKRRYQEAHALLLPAPDAGA